MALIWHVSRFAYFAASITRINNNVFNMAVQEGYMDRRCYIMDPTNFVKALGWNATYTGVHAPADYICKPNEAEILRWEVVDRGKTWSHFTAGNGTGICTYDPWYHPRGGSLAVAEGAVVSKRIFRY